MTAPQTENEVRYQNAALADENKRLAFVMGEIARGRTDNGRPLAAETSRQMAREIMSRLNLKWPAITGGMGGTAT